MILENSGNPVYRNQVQDYEELLKGPASVGKKD